jgi:hypothetical protein
MQIKYLQLQSSMQAKPVGWYEAERPEKRVPIALLLLRIEAEVYDLIVDSLSGVDVGRSGGCCCRGGCDVLLRLESKQSAQA